MNAGTLAELLIRKGFTTYARAEEFVRFATVLVNGVPAVSAWRVLEFGDRVQVAGEVFEIR